MRWPTLTVLGVAALTGLLLTSGATLAAVPVDGSAVQEVRLGSSSALVPLQVDRLYPGHSAVARFLLDRGSTVAEGGFATGIEDLEDFERTCNRAERSTGDTTCSGDAGQGELSRQLLIGHAWAPADGCEDAAVPTTGQVMASLGDAALRAPASLAQLDRVCLVLGLLLPFSADNLVQSDRIRFDLRLGLDTASSSPAAGGAPIAGTDEAPAVGGGGSSAGGTVGGLQRPASLPLTGLDLSTALACAAMLLAVGGLTTLQTRRPRGKGGKTS